MPIPELTVVTQPADTNAATAALADIVKTLKQQAKGGFPAFDLVQASIGGQLVISTSQKGIDDFRAGGSKLSGDAAFKDAQQAAAMPAQTTGFLYVNVKDALPLVRLAGPMLGLSLPAALQTADLSALRSLTAYGSRTGAEESYTVFLQVR
jgi:hypothetical protein